MTYITEGKVLGFNVIIKFLVNISIDAIFARRKKDIFVQFVKIL